MKEQLRKYKGLLLSVAIIGMIIIVLYISVRLLTRLNAISEQAYDDKIVETLNNEDGAGTEGAGRVEKINDLKNRDMNQANNEDSHKSEEDPQADDNHKSEEGLKTEGDHKSEDDLKIEDNQKPVNDRKTEENLMAEEDRKRDENRKTEEDKKTEDNHKSEEERKTDDKHKSGEDKKTEKASETTDVIFDNIYPEGSDESEQGNKAKPEGEGKLIVIDAGHQAKGNNETEPIGPGAKTKKAKVSSGTQGVSTGLAEYKLNLTVSMKLKEELLARGYRVIMVRESHEVNLSNSERAAIANEAKADAFIRIHANSSDNSKVKGILTICQTKANPYNGELYKINKSLSEKVLKHMVEKTGAVNKGVWEMDTMSGINWCTVPVTIVEMGYMSNAEEDKLLASDSYQDKIVLGIADGLDEFFKNQ